MLKRIAIVVVLLATPLLAAEVAAEVAADGFVHPGLLVTRADIDFMRSRVAAGAQPWADAWTTLRGAKVADLAWSPKAIREVVRGPYNRPDIGSTAIIEDSAAAYAHALQWVVSGDERHAQAARTVLTAWSTTMTAIAGEDRKLLAGITAYKFCNAAELLRATWPGWTAADDAGMRAWLGAVFVPLIRDFMPASNGNWDASMICSLMAIGIYSDDRALFERAVAYFRHGEGNGSIRHYVRPGSGQCQESTRDQHHVQLGLGLLATACAQAWNQGVDLWSEADDRLALGFEYTARYNLGFEVPCEGVISPIRRGEFRPIYERAYQHYHAVKGLDMPFTRQVVERTRPEGWHFDHDSWGTLTAWRGRPQDGAAAPVRWWRVDAAPAWTVVGAAAGADPASDADGRPVRPDTHFAGRAEAWQRLAGMADARVCAAGERIRLRIGDLAAAYKEAGDAAALRAQVRERMQAALGR